MYYIGIHEVCIRLRKGAGSACCTVRQCEGVGGSRWPTEVWGVYPGQGCRWNNTRMPAGRGAVDRIRRRGGERSAVGHRGRGHV